MRVLGLALLLLAAPAGAATIVLDFEEETPGFYFNSFVSAECDCVRLSEEVHELRVVDRYGTRVLVVGEEGGDLLLEFLVPVVGVSLDFVSFYLSSEEIDYYDAHLTAYAGGEIVGEVTVTPDPGGPLFQTISLFPGTVIERAVFVRNALGENEPFSPVVDNIVLTTVPEPGTIGLLALVLAAVASRRAAPTIS